ncbi:MAG: hypothetical protein AAB426_13060 [Myxococcota bacterium]
MFGLAKGVGGQKVEAGSYWNLESGERVELTQGGTLPGGSGDAYYRIPPAGVLLMAPVLGLTYAIFLPFIGIAMVATATGRRLFGGVTESLWKAASFGWQPSEAYLLGKKGKRAKRGTKEDKRASHDKGNDATTH